MSTTAERDSETTRRRGRLSRRGGRGGGAGGRDGASGGGGGGLLLPLLIVAVALVVTGIGALIVSSSYDTPRKAAVLGPNLAINDGAANPRDLNANNSPTLIRNPVERNNLVTVNRIDSPAYSCSLNVSFDGGGRWTQTPIPAPAGEEPKCFAPDAAFSSDGTLYISYVTLKGRANAPNAVWITSSTDGGKTLSPPAETPLGQKAFQVRLTADPQSPKRLHLTWLKAGELGLYTFSNTGNPIMSVRSDDGGNNWSTPVRVSSPSRQRVVAPAPAVGKGPDELNVLYLDLGDDVLDYGGGHRGRGGAPYDGKWQLVLARSTDNGATWKESIVDDSIVPTERFIVFTPPTPSIAVDRDSGRVYAAFQDGRDGDANGTAPPAPAVVGARDDDRIAGREPQGPDLARLHPAEVERPGPAGIGGDAHLEGERAGDPARRRQRPAAVARGRDPGGARGVAAALQRHVGDVEGAVGGKDGIRRVALAPGPARDRHARGPPAPAGVARDMHRAGEVR